MDLNRFLAPFRPPSTHLVDRLRYWAAELPEQTAFVFWNGEHQKETSVTYAELDRQARTVAAELAARRLEGQRVLLLYQPGLEFVAGLFGCLYAGAVAVPAYPPRRSRNMERIEAIGSDAQAALILTTQDVIDRQRGEPAPHLRLLPWLGTDRLGEELASRWEPPALNDDTLAVLQYTSGSTGAPKGVMLSHGNLMANCGLIMYGFEPCRHTGVGFFWLPTYHDMGLVGGILEPVYMGRPTVLMPPLAFLQKPVRWLRGISRFRATMSGGPNFAFALCNDKITPEDCEGLDLSSWDVAFNGAEPIRAETLETFTRKFEPYGFRAAAHYPCYGMAETTLIVSGGIKREPPIIRSFDAQALDEHRVLPARAGAAGQAQRRLVSSGRVLPGEEAAIVDPETGRPLSGECVGEIWIHSSSVAQGYWNKDAETQRTFGARLEGDPRPYLRTGDLGFLQDGELFVTGRCKDLIIIRGRNLYPHDVELTVDKCHPSLPTGTGACFAIEVGNEERLVVVHELSRKRGQTNFQEIIAAIREAVLEDHEAPLHSVCLLKPGKLPKTSSGKVQRSACRTAYLQGELEAVAQWTDEPAARGREAVAAHESAARLGSAGEIQTWLVSKVAARLGRSAAEIDVHQPFARFGLDSLALVELSGELEQFIGRAVLPTALYSYPTIEALARHLAGARGQAAQQARAAQAHAEPIAVVGLACRFPGAETPAAFWELLSEGRDAIGEIPATRWNASAYYNADQAAAGSMYTRHGGFLGDVAGFDPQFFGIAPREAQAIDPQQRLLLEVAWETLENAAASPDRLADSPLGVFVGISNCDYARLQNGRDLAQIDAYSGTGTAFSIAAGRLAYVLGVHGPCLAVDTACSSSLVAVHLAVQSLRNGECRAALAGGVNLMLDPATAVALCRLQALSPDGRCKSFDASADGYGRGEGCGMLLLKRLSDAVTDGDQIWAVIRGSAVNHDGRSNGLTAPHEPSQEALLRAALADANVEPADVGYIEAHGTGTSLGDPIEMQALAAVLGADREGTGPKLLARADAPPKLVVGSVKTNIGHLEAAAGIAGLIKAILALKEGQIPPHLHLNTPSPYIPWDQIPVTIPAALTDWPKQQRRIAGVSSFGFSGTNAHVILEESPQPRHAANVGRSATPSHGHVGRSATPSHNHPLSELLVLSAKDEAAMRELAARYADHLNDHAGDFPGMCQTAAVGRAHFSHRLAIVAESGAEAGGKLAQFAWNERPAGLVQGRVGEERRPKVAFLFTGQGAQFVGMAQQLYETQPVFRQAIDQCETILRQHLHGSLLSVLHGKDDAAAPLHQTQYTQPALFAVEYALYELWKSWGVEPDLVLGHSIGEYVAAWSLGVFSLEDALKLVAARGRLMQGLPETGAMVAVAADERTVTALLHHSNGKNDKLNGHIDVAALNSPQQTVLSGSAAGVNAAVATLEAAGLRTRRLQVSHAFHSSLMEPMLDEFEQVCRQVTFDPPQGQMASSVTGQMIEGEIATPEYWREQIRSTVRFAEALAAVDAQGADVYLEIGPRPILTAAGRQTLPDRGQLWLASLRPGREDWPQMLDCLAELYVRGAAIDWPGFHRDSPRRIVPLPNYPFQRSRYWFEESQPRQAVGRSATPSHDKVGRSATPSHETRDVSLHDCLFEVAWQPRSRFDQPQNRPAAEFIPAASELSQAVRPEIDRLLAQLRLPRYVELSAALDRLSVAYVWSALEKLGWQPKPGESFSEEELAERLHVAAGRRRLFGRLLGMLADEGLLVRTENRRQVAESAKPAEPSALMADLAARYPECSAELTLLANCAGNLAGVLSAEIDPLQLLFPEGSSELVGRLYKDSPFARSLNALVEETIAAAIARLPAGRSLKILEIGAGTGGATAQLLPLLPADRTEYCFTDVSQVFTHDAAARFRQYPFVRYEVLDIESDPAAQGFAPHQFDLVLAANVLHATADLKRSLAHVQELLAPQGALVLLEGTRPERWLDLIFGLTDGWWRFSSDGVRADHPLVSAETWQRLLLEQGFAEAAAFPPTVANEEAAPQAVIFARTQPLTTAPAPAEPRPLAPIEAQATAGWLILTDRGGAGAALAESLRARGRQCVLVSHGQQFLAASPTEYTVASGGDFRDVFKALGASNGYPLEGVVHLWSLDAATADELTPERLKQAEWLACQSAVELLQEMIPLAATSSPRVWLVTRGAQGVQPGEALPGVAQSLAWGLGRVVAEEHSALWGGLVDLDPTLPLPEAAGALAGELIHPQGGRESSENQVAYRGGQRYAARLVRRPRDAGERRQLRWRTDAAYLVTGGLGDIGLRVAEWMVNQGAHHLVLVGRSPFPPRERWNEVAKTGSRQALQVQGIQALEAQGATVLALSLDVGDEAAVKGLLETLRREGWPPLRGVIHCAGMPDARPLTEIRPERMAEVFRPKVAGLWNLHSALKAERLDFFVGFSSAGALLASPLLGIYSAANSFVDALARHRRGSGLAGLSINWGFWEQTENLSPDLVGVGLSIMHAGMRPIATQQGLAALQHLLEHGAVNTAVMPVDLEEWSRHHPIASQSPFLSNLRMTEAAAAPKSAAEGDQVSAPRARIVAAAPEARRDLAEDYFRDEISRVLRLPPAGLDAHQSLNNLGIDSLMAVELRNHVQAHLGVTIPLAKLLQDPTIAQLAGVVLEQLGDAPIDQSPLSPVPAPHYLAGPLSGAADSAAAALAQAAGAVSGDVALEATLARLHELSDEEVDAMLRQVLSKERSQKEK